MKNVFGQKPKGKEEGKEILASVVTTFILFLFKTEYKNNKQNFKRMT